MKNKVLKLIALMSALLIGASLAACGSSAPQLSAEELGNKFEQSIYDAVGGKENAQPALTNNSDFMFLIAQDPSLLGQEGFTEEELKANFPSYVSMMMDTLGLKTEDMSAYALSVNMINIKAYAIAVIRPAEGKEQAVVDAVNQYVANVQKSFEQYLQDQYEISKTAKVEVQKDGTVVLVMCEDGANVYQKLIENLQK